MQTRTLFIAAAASLAMLWSCSETTKTKNPMQEKVDQFALVDLKSDLSHLTVNQKQMLVKLIEVGEIMEDLFWKDAFNKDRETFLASLPDEATRQFARIMYGPWNRMEANKPFVDGYGKKPAGANYYPADITLEEFEAWEEPNKLDWYSLVRRDEQGKLIMIPYHVAYKEEITRAATLLREASEMAEDEGFKKYLSLRAEALETDDYLASDMAWMDMKTNKIDFVVGPIESYEDQLVGARAAHSAQILIKDLEWSAKLDRFGELLPKLQASLPCDDKYKQEKAHAVANMYVYDVVLYRGDCNAGSKNIAINLPNDPRVHAAKGSRKLQLKNAMQAKFDKILLPISDLVIDPSQRKHVKFDAFFENVMFHEVGHGLGIKETISGKGTVRDAMKDTYSSIEENKADLMGLFMVAKLTEMGEYPDKDIMDNYVTFMAGLFRSIRFGATSAHGVANLMRFNYFAELGAFTRDEKAGTYKVNFDKMTLALNNLINETLTIQGEGDYETAKKWIEERGIMTEELKNDLARINSAGIPVDIQFNQGAKVLGL
ncbi:MAG: Zn-dependent hydrolase [Salinivirgaceae bacterium]|nr:Zn-dependent hydrolase [Salinivirgaceae bacterium]